ncbi:MAG TPA: SCO family protein [Pyrinomonadaceae bacterium]|nr:SCO family protein [Pyrinomonadaceae bacterium]
MLIKVLMVVLLSGGVYTMPAQTKSSAARYVCPMHPDVTSSRPGKCPKCKMALRLTRTKTEKGAPPETKSTESGAVSSPRLPDVMVQDQNGKSLNFYTDLVKGKVVAVNFVFTTCTAICPSLTATFRRVQQQLAEQKVPTQLISISVDPTVDTPERLQEFAAKFKAETGWTFVTGNTSDIDSILNAFGVGVANKNDHTPMVLIGNDEAGYWTRTYGLSSPTSLVKLITEAANRK